MQVFKVAQLGLAWASGQTCLSYPPKDVSIEPTNYCNYRCNFCPQSEPVHHTLPHGFMSLEQLEVILEKVQRSGAAWHRVINFTHDGEPFLHPDFPEFIRRATERGYRTRFSSNGSKLTPEKLGQLTAAGARFRARIDFSGDRDVFQSIRSKKNDWEIVRGHIAHLIRVSNANPDVRVEVHEISGYSLPRAEAMANLARLRLMLPEPTSKRVRFTICNFHNATGLVQIGAAAPKGRSYHRCPYPWTSLNVAWNGDVHACPRDLRGRTRLGNLLEAESLEAIWNGPAYQAFRRQHLEQRVAEIASCHDCDLPWRHDPQRWSAKQIYYRLRDV